MKIAKKKVKEAAEDNFLEKFQVSFEGLPKIKFYVKEEDAKNLISSFRTLEANKNVSSLSILKEIIKGEKYENKFLSICLREEILPKKV